MGQMGGRGEGGEVGGWHPLPSGIVVDFDSLAPHLESCQGLSVLSIEEAIQLAYGTLVVLNSGVCSLLK